MMNLVGKSERLRRLYEARVPQTVPACGEYFNQQPVRVLADGDRVVLGGVP